MFVAPTELDLDGGALRGPEGGRGRGEEELVSISSSSGSSSSVAIRPPREELGRCTIADFARWGGARRGSRGECPVDAGLSILLFKLVVLGTPRRGSPEGDINWAEESPLPMPLRLLAGF